MPKKKKIDRYRQLRLKPIDIFLQRQVTHRDITWKKTVLNHSVLVQWFGTLLPCLRTTPSTMSAVLSQPLFSGLCQCLLMPVFPDCN
jgi:hypothetical protein